MEERWKEICEPGNIRAIGKENGVDPLLARAMLNRKVTASEAEAYFHGRLSDLADPSLMKDMELTISLLLERRELEDQRIAIASDYDSDGLLSGYTLSIILQRIGLKPDIWIPDRVREGYGLNERIVREIHEKGISILITCDNGIAASEAVELAKSLGMTVIVTDHHEVRFKEIDGERTYLLPCADAILNPKQPGCEYPFKHLCGAGVVFRLGQALYDRLGIEREELYQLIPFTAIATVADVVELLGENRIIVKDGLQRIKQCQNPGLKALIEALNLDQNHITSYHIGFRIAPCFNAAGRIASIFDALSLLQEENEEEARKKACQLRELNEERKRQTEQGVIKAKAYIEQHLASEDVEEPFRGHEVFVIYLPDVHESIAGIIAGRIRESYHHPVFVFTDAENGVKGSGRSIEDYNMFEEIQKCEDLLDHFGGHPMAAGLSLQKENLEILEQRLNQNCMLKREDFFPVVPIDANVPFFYLTIPRIEQLEMLEPFGKGNESPLFIQRNAKIIDAKVLGKDGNTVKLTAVGDRDTRLEVMLFSQKEEFLSYLDEKFSKVQREQLFAGGRNEVCLDLVYEPNINVYNGMSKIQAFLRHYRRSEG